MLRFLLFVLLVGFNSATAAETEASQPKVIAVQEAPKCVSVASLDKDGVERRGCCSWHGGVCGCSGVRAQCCDGTLSPSCGCHKDELKITN